MSTYTIERQYLAPVYQHLTIEAETAEAAMRAAMDAEDWSSGVIDTENARPHHISGCWVGGKAYAGESHAIPRELGAPVPRIVIAIEGGMVSSVLADAETDVTLIDYDIDGCDSDVTCLIPQGLGLPPESACRSTYEAELNSARIDEINAAPLQFDYDAPVDEMVLRWVNCRVPAPLPPSEQRVLWRASFAIDGCPFELSFLLPVTTIDQATDMAQRCLDELWPDQLEKLDQSFLPGRQTAL